MHPLFDGLSTEELETVEGALEPFSFKKGETVFSAGQTPRGLYIIDEGYVEILPDRTLPQHVPELRLKKGPHDFFGEMSLIDRREHAAKAVALSEVKGLLLPREVFYELVERTPVFLFNLTSYALSHLRAQDTQLILELSRAKSAAEQHIERLNVLISTSKVLNSTLDLDRLLEIILNEATHHTDSDAGTIYILDKKNNELVSRVIYESTIEEIRIPVGVGIAGTVAQTGEIINIPDAYADNRFNKEIDSQSGYHTQNILAVPMRGEDGQIVGVVQLLNKKYGSFSLSEEQFIEAMSIHASIAIEKTRLAEQIAHTRSLAALGRFAATIIHDFKNPITVIYGNTQILRTLIDNEETDKYLDNILKQADRIAGMTEEVLSFSRDEKTLRLQELHVGVFLKEVVNSIQMDSKERGVTLDIAVSEPDKYARFDPGKLKRVVQNLVSNAFDAMPDGGKLTFELRFGQEHWELEVGDTGTGIPADRIDTIFDSFVTFGKKHGTGLGLAIVNKIIENHKGTISVSSKEGEGAVFRLNLPYDPEAKEN